MAILVLCLPIILPSVCFCHILLRELLKKNAALILTSSIRTGGGGFQRKPKNFGHFLPNIGWIRMHKSVLGQSIATHAYIYSLWFCLLNFLTWILVIIIFLLDKCFLQKSVPKVQRFWLLEKCPKRSQNIQNSGGEGSDKFQIKAAFFLEAPLAAARWGWHFNL